MCTRRVLKDIKVLKDAMHYSKIYINVLIKNKKKIKNSNDYPLLREQKDHHLLLHSFIPVRHVSSYKPITSLRPINWHDNCVFWLISSHSSDYYAMIVFSGYVCRKCFIACRYYRIATEPQVSENFYKSFYIFYISLFFHFLFQIIMYSILVDEISSKSVCYSSVKEAITVAMAIL